MTLRLLAWRLLACVIALVAWAGSVAPASADRQVAFVVGNSRYEKAEPLANAQRDAAAVADRLRDLGFEVTEVFDGDAFTLNRAADRFVTQARSADLALFYFAGHGVQLFDQNFLLARDVDPNRIAEVA
ncbi:MAG: caspase family protein, partial [Pseudorhodoplanes sp.]